MTENMKLIPLYTADTIWWTAMQTGRWTDLSHWLLSEMKGQITRYQQPALKRLPVTNSGEGTQNIR